MTETKLCYWCHEPLPPLSKDASYVDELNHYMHDDCRAERDEQNHRREQLLTGIADVTIDSIPDVVRTAVLERIKRLGFARRCPCLYDDAYGFRGYAALDVGADDADNAIALCELCRGSGTYDPLPQLRALTDDKVAAQWVAAELPKSAGPCDLWRGFPEAGWHYDALGYNRHSPTQVRGVMVYNVGHMRGGVISWLEVAELFRPRTQSSLF